MRLAMWIAALAAPAAWSAIEDVRTMGVTNTQATIAYRAPDASACSVEVSESAAYTPLVHDVNPAVFAGANLDSRSTSANRGRDRLMVVGRRTIDKGADTKNYSRALQASTKHYFRITCGAEQASGTFHTASLPLGETHTDTYIPDPAIPGEYKYVSADIFTRNHTWIDPHTGVQTRLLQKAQDWYEAGEAAAELVSSSGWTNANNFISSAAGQYAVYDGSSCVDGNCGRVLISRPIVQTWLAYYVQTDFYSVKLTGFGTSPVEADRQVKVCLVPVVSGAAGTECDTDPGAIVMTLTLPQNTEGTVEAKGTFRVPDRKIGVGSFLVSGDWAARLRANVWKVNGNGSINVRAARIGWQGSHGSSVGTAGGHDRCSQVLRSDGFYLCTTFRGGETQTLYLVHGETGEVRFLGRLDWLPNIGSMSCNNDHQPYHSTNPNIWYCQPSSTGYFGELTYVGNGQNKADNYQMKLGIDYTVRWLMTNIGAAVSAFYTAHESEWVEMLGGAGNFNRFPGKFNCAVNSFQQGYLVGLCLAGNQDSPAWPFAIDATTGAVVGMYPQYAAAPNRWCMNHTQDISDSRVFTNTMKWPFFYSVLASPVNASSQQITLTSTCTNGCEGFHTGDPVKYDAGVSQDFIMPYQVGDYLKLVPAATGAVELMKITGKNGATLTVQRGVSGGASPQNGVAGDPVYPVCYSKPGSTLNPVSLSYQVIHGVWDFIKDPYGKSVDGSGVWTINYSSHVAFRGNRSVNGGFVYKTPPGTKLLELDKAYNNPATHRWDPLGFGGQVGTGLGLSYQTHASIGNTTQTGIGAGSVFDAHPFVGGQFFSPITANCNPNAPGVDVNPATGCAISKIAGFNNVYRYVADGFPLLRKHYQTFGMVGTNALRDVSGPNCVINDSTPYAMGIVVQAGECVPGSLPGQIYFNSPKAMTLNYCYAGESYPYGTVDACIGNVEYVAGAGTQTVHGARHNRWGMKEMSHTLVDINRFLPRASGAGEIRMLYRHAGNAPYRRMPVFSTVRPLANGKFGMIDWAHMYEGGHIGLIKIPPIVLDSVNRTAFSAIDVDISWVPSGTHNAVIEFGYSEYWEPNQFRCTQRAETCVAHRSGINNSNPFSFATSESYTGVACANGCRITIPAYPSRVAYYRTVFRNASNQVILRGPMQAIATP